MIICTTPKTNRTRTIEARNDLPRFWIIWIMCSPSPKSASINISKLFVLMPCIRVIRCTQKLRRFWLLMFGKWRLSRFQLEMIRCVVSHDSVCPLPIRQSTCSHGLLHVSLRVGKAGVGDALRVVVCDARQRARAVQTKLILSSRFRLLNVILKSIFGALECDSQKHILIA